MPIWNSQMHLVKQACLYSQRCHGSRNCRGGVIRPAFRFRLAKCPRWVLRDRNAMSAQVRFTPDSDRTGSCSSYLIASAVMKGIEVGMPAEGRHDNAQKPTPPLRYNRSESRTGRDRLIRNHQRLSKCFCGRRLSRPLRYPNGLGFVRLIIPDLGCAPRRSF